jgi:hypothetical protein
MPDAGNVTASSLDYASALMPARRIDTDSSLNDYRLERDACCPAEQ